jgi:predicted nucleic acid-binding OB-fold protein
LQGNDGSKEGKEIIVERKNDVFTEYSQLRKILSPNNTPVLSLDPFQFGIRGWHKC